MKLMLLGSAGIAAVIGSIVFAFVEPDADATGGSASAWAGDEARRDAVERQARARE